MTKKIENQLFPISSMMLRLCNMTIIRFVSTLYLIATIQIGLIQLIYCFAHFTQQNCGLYGPICLPWSFIVIQHLGTLLSFSSYKKMGVYINSMLCWDISGLSPRIREMIKAKCKNAEYFSIFITISGVAIFQLVHQDLEPAYEKYIVVATYASYHSSLYSYFIIAGKALYIVWTLALINSTIFTQYCYIFLQVQLLGLNGEILAALDRLKKMNLDPDVVKRCLKKIAQKHHAILRFDTFLYGTMYPILITFFSNGMILGSPLIALFACTHDFSRATSTCIITVILVAYAVVCTQGQLTEDMTDELQTLLQDFKWYEWTQSNKKIFHILLANISMRLKWNSITRVHGINHRAYTQCFKFFMMSLQNFFIYSSRSPKPLT